MDCVNLEGNIRVQTINAPIGNKLEKIKTGLTQSIAMTFLPATGCTSHQVFEGIKSRNQNECYTLPETQQEECLEVSDISLEEYQRRREESQKSE